MDDFLGRPLYVGAYVVFYSPLDKVLTLSRIRSFTHSGSVIIKYPSLDPTLVKKWDLIYAQPQELVIVDDKYVLQNILTNPIPID